MKEEDPKDATAADGELQLEVGPQGAGQRLDVFVANQPGVASRSLAKNLIQAGQVLVDGRLGKPGQVLATDQVVRLRLDLERPVTASADGAVGERGLTVLFEDSWLLVIDKPAGISVHPADRPSPHPTVSELAALDRPDLPRSAGHDRPGIVHRLDKETSGVMTLAKTEEAHNHLKAQFKQRKVHKEYLAISHGEARFDSDHIERNIARHPRQGDRMVVVGEGGRDAFTFYEVLERLAGFTLFRCVPKTGRTHQIRVHLTSIGHSLVGDRIYRSRKAQQARLPEGAPDPGRHCLHAKTLSFLHPETGEAVSFEAPMPRDMQRLLDFLAALKGE